MGEARRLAQIEAAEPNTYYHEGAADARLLQLSSVWQLQMNLGMIKDARMELRGEIDAATEEEVTDCLCILLADNSVTERRSCCTDGRSVVPGEYIRPV